MDETLHTVRRRVVLLTGVILAMLAPMQARGEAVAGPHETPVVEQVFRIELSRQVTGDVRRQERQGHNPQTEPTAK